MTGPTPLTPEQQALAAVLQAFQSGIASQAAETARFSDHKRKRASSTSSRASAQPLLAPVFNEPLLAYFSRLKPLAAELDVKLVKRDEPFTQDGIYLHKRPVIASSGGPGAVLALAGTVMYHVILYIKDGRSLHKLEYGPYGGRDITTNLAVSVPCHPTLTENATIPAEDTLPFLYLGPCTATLDSPTVKQAIKFAESLHYNAVRNNCIHFADLMVRILTGGRLRSAPLVYDALAGGLPAQEPAMLAMMPLAMGCTWFQAVDGSKLYEQVTAQSAVGVEGAGQASSLVHSSSSESLPLKRQETAEKDGTESRESSAGALEMRLEASNNPVGLEKDEEVQEAQKVVA